MVEASGDIVEAHLAALDLARGLYRGHKVLAFGNGGSASQASHFAGELLGRYAPGARRGLAAVAPARAMPASPLASPMNDFALISRVRFA
jgi:phosphoheptose isomerase